MNESFARDYGKRTRLTKLSLLDASIRWMGFEFDVIWTN